MSVALQREIAGDRLVDSIAALRRALATAKADTIAADRALDGLGGRSEPHALMAAVAAAQRTFDSAVAANVAATDVANVLEILAALKAAGQEVA